MLFKDLAHTLNRIESTAARNEITQLLADLFNQATAPEARKIAYFLLGDIKAKYEGSTFGLAEKNLAVGLANQFKSGGDGDQDFLALFKELGDLGLAVGQAHVGQPSDLPVDEVHETLCQLASMQGSGVVEQKIAVVADLLDKCDADAAKFLVRIISGKLRLGVSEMTILDALSWMVVGDKSLKKRLEAAYNVCADIGVIAELVKEAGPSAIDALEAIPGIPLRPAAAERLESGVAIVEKLGTVAAQPKLDGLRLQMHVFTDDEGNRQVKLFSRNLLDITHMFPRVCEAVRALGVKDCIADGEVIAIDPVSGRFLPFQETSKRRRKHDVGAKVDEIPVQLHLFDLLYLDGTLLFHEPHTIRRTKLVTVCADSAPMIQPVDEKIFDDGEKLEAYFDELIADGLEGLVAKRLDGTYKAGKRNYNWIKLKRIEKGDLADTIDAVVLGYYRGQGRRGKFGIGALLVGVFNERLDRIESIAKVGTGLSDDDLMTFKKDCDALQISAYSSKTCVNRELMPDVLTDAKIVCSIRADEISRSKLHTAGAVDGSQGFALRFPRIILRRFDKSLSDITTVKEVEDLYAIQMKKRGF